jgi:class 3 adenylate cyclase/tetratricopeptide (TPR) repeat protein
MKCAACGFENPDGFTFCGKCGTPLSSACSACGFQNPPGLAFCGKCGAPLEQPSAEILALADLDHLRSYLPPTLVEGLQFDRLSPPPRLLEACTSHLSELLNTVCSLLPTYVVEQVVRDPVPGRVGGRFIDGTLLFADISGFTSMSERLSRIGREGAEEITAIVNRYFTTMLSILRDHDGQLVKFGGDALLGLFLEPDSASRAVLAAQTMQTAMAGFSQVDTSQGTFGLQMKVGVHRGQFFAAQLGTAQNMEFALFGSDVNAAATTESLATPGQVLLDQATLEAITLPCQVIAGPSGYSVVTETKIISAFSAPHQPPIPSFPEPSLESLRRLAELLDVLTPYMPAGLLGRIATAPRAVGLEGEHRLVAVLFANLHGLGEIADRLGVGREADIVSGINQCFTAVENGIRRFGGVVNKIDLSEHGDKLLAFFGAPVAHEDDAERAVRAALAMQEALSETSGSLPTQLGLPDLRLEQKVGISVGYVFAGYVGTSWRHEYTVMGDEVNFGARLMAVAEPGSVTVSSDVRRKVQALFELSPRGEVALKGKSLPVHVFSVLGPRAVPQPLRGLEGMRSPLVGRQAEWEQLMKATDQLALGQGQVVCIIGEAGLGKSRLVAELRQGMAAKPIRWIEGRCLSYTESVPYGAFQAVLQDLIGIDPDDSEAEAWGKLRTIVEQSLAPEDVEFTLPYLASFLRLELGDALQEKVRYLDAEALQQRTFVAISTLIEAQLSLEPAVSPAERPTLSSVEGPDLSPADSPDGHPPLVLVLDDIHWIDQASLTLLEHLLPLVDRVPLMLLLLYRPERAKRCWEAHEKIAREFAHRATEIALQNLTSVDGQHLLTNLVGIEEWPREISEAILSRTEGNPLYVEEVIRTLIDDGTLARKDGGQWRLAGDIQAIKVPDTLQGVMMARLDRLDEPTRWTAQLASVVGRVFPFDVLAHVVPENGAQLNRCMVRLQQHETIRETQRTPELVYTFKHTMMQEVCYHSLLARIRRLYHRKVAEYIETGRSTGRREAEGNIPLIAHHAFEGQDWHRGLRYQLQAGQQAQKLFANHEAIDHLEKALQCADHLTPAETQMERLAIHGTLGELLFTTGQFDHALEHLTEARSLAIECQSRDAEARACRWLASLYENRGEYIPAFDWIQQGLLAVGGRETAEAAQLWIVGGLINSRRGDYDVAQQHCNRALQIAEELGELAALARAYVLLGHITRTLGNSAQAIEHFQQAFELYQRVGDINQQAVARNQIANAHFYMGQWKEAETHYLQAREIFDQIGDVYNRVFADNNLGGIAKNQGRLDEALAFYQRALLALEQIGGSTYVLGVVHMNLGHTYVRRGEIEAAHQHLRTSLDYYEQAEVRDFLSETYRARAEAALLAGELLQAEEDGQQALDLARELAMRAEEGIALRVLGEVATARGQFADAKRFLDDSLVVLESVGDEYEWALTQLSLARLYACFENPTGVTSALEQCTPVFERLGATLDLDMACSMQESTTPPQAAGLVPDL